MMEAVRLVRTESFTSVTAAFLELSRKSGRGSKICPSPRLHGIIMRVIPRFRDRGPRITDRGISVKLELIDFRVLYLFSDQKIGLKHTKPSLVRGTDYDN